MGKILLFLVYAAFLFQCDAGRNEVKTMYLDELAFGEILDPYGPPKRNTDFSGDTLELKGIIYPQGLGLHAPSTLYLDLDGRGITFQATVGVDSDVAYFSSRETRGKLGNVANYVYDNRVDHYDFTKGGSVIFEVYLDGELRYSSGLMNQNTPPQQINLSLKGADQMILKAEPTDDGSFADYANWGMARLSFRGNPEDLEIYHHASAILVNHAGFLPDGFKTCYRHGYQAVPFNLVNAENDKMVYSGQFEPAEGDLGSYLRGDFSTFTAPGKYYLTSDTLRSEVFEVKEEIYEECLRKHLMYVKQQRSGHPEEGWAPGNHLDDGIRQDNGRHQDVSGGWYDANDLRKPAKGNTLLLFALAEVAGGKNGISRELLLDEIRWGNKFLFSMQEPEGYLLHYIGFTWEGYRENNWTDNVTGTEDDRTIITRAADINTQLVFVAAEAKIAGEFNNIDSGYAQQCFRAATRAWEWIRREGEIKDPEDLGVALTAAASLFRVSGKDLYRQDAENFLNRLLSLQETEDGTIGGHFFDLSTQGTREGGLTMIGLSDFIRTFPEHPQKGEALKAIERFAEEYYMVVAGTSAFSNIPWIISRDTLESGKKLGSYWYKHFLHVGMNQHLSRNGAGLVAAGEVLGRPEYVRIAQRQLDWIYGANPFNASTVTGIGYNQPDLFKTSASEYKPYTPELTGGVMTGIGSNHPKDDIALYPGWWWTTEYWSPTVTYTIVLVNKLNSYELSN